MPSATIPFDTHAFVKRLTAAGVPEPQAEVHAEAIAELVNEQLATKRDLAELETRLRNDLRELELRLRSDMERTTRELEVRLLLRLGGMLAAAVAIVAALVKLL